MRYVSLFSGIEAATVAWEPLGWEPVAFSEIEPFCCELLKQRFPNVPNLGDITAVDWERFKNERGTIDLVAGGSPCQSFSVAGKREGLGGASGLMFEYIRAVQKLRPRWFVWENVPGALTSDHGRAFWQLLGEMADVGYCLAWRVLDAQYFGVAQRRPRVFLVGNLGGFDPAEVLFEQESMRRNPTTDRARRAVHAAESTDGDKTVHEYACMSGTLANAKTADGDGVMGTLRAQMFKDIPVICERTTGPLQARDYKGVGNQFVQEGKIVAQGWKVRRITPTECERLQGFPDGWTDLHGRVIAHKDGTTSLAPGETLDSHRYKALGNSMAVPVMRWIGERIDALEKRGR